MNVDWNAIRAELSEHLDYYAAEHQHPVNQVFHFLGVPMIILGLPVGLVSPLLGVGMAVGGAALQVLGHMMFEANKPTLGKRGSLYLLAAPLWVAEVILSRLGLSLRELIGLTATSSIPDLV